MRDFLGGFLAWAAYFAIAFVLIAVLLLVLESLPGG